DGTELGVLKDLVVLVATAAVRALCTFFAFGTHAGLDTIRALGAIGTRSALAPGAFFTAPATTLAAFATLAIARALAVVTGGRLHGHGQGSRFRSRRTAHAQPGRQLAQEATESGRRRGQNGSGCRLSGRRAEHGRGLCRRNA